MNSIITYKVVNNTTNKTVFNGTLKACEGFLWDLYMDDSSDEGLWVHCFIE